MLIAVCGIALPFAADYTRGRDEILRHVDELIKQLTGRNGP
jgi:hypothetical protein